MRVIAAPGTKCPKEGKPRQYISDKKAEEVSGSVYYRRLIKDGSLKEVKEAQKRKQPIDLVKTNPKGGKKS